MDGANIIVKMEHLAQSFGPSDGITAIRVLTDTVGARILRCRVKEI